VSKKIARTEPKEEFPNPGACGNRNLEAFKESAHLLGGIVWKITKLL
jgi:hypothetical protein